MSTNPKISDPFLEPDFAKDNDSIIYMDAVRQIFRDNGWHALGVDLSTIENYEKDPATGNLIVSDIRKYRSCVSRLILEAYGVPLWEFHGDVDLKEKYMMTDEHIEFIKMSSDVNSAIRSHSRQYQGDGIGDDKFSFKTINDEQNIVKIDQKKADEHYKVMLSANIKRLESLLKTATGAKKTELEEAIEKMSNTLSSLSV